MDIKGDTLIMFNVNDARTVLLDLLDKETVDSLLKVYEKSDSLYSNALYIASEDIKKLQLGSKAKDEQLANLNAILENKDTKIDDDKDIIAKKDKIIKHQKVVKWVGWGVAAAAIIALLL